MTGDCRWLDVSPDYYGRLHTFECATPSAESFGGAKKKHGLYYHEYQLEVQSAIRDFRKCDPSCQWAHICVSPDSDGNDRILSFVWFGVIGGRFTDSNGCYTIGRIARALSAEGCKFGDFTLKHALDVMEQDQKRTSRPDVITARVDPENEASLQMFLRNGFEDYGPDPEEPAYRRLVRFGFS